MRRDSSGRFVGGSHWRAPRAHWNREWLVEMYVARERSAGDIAVEIGTTDANVLYWLKKHGIARRTVSQARALKRWGASGAANPMHGKTGARNPRFVDGSSPERQRLYAQGHGREFLRSVMARDGYRCRKCAKPKTFPKSLHVHHVRPWAGNEGARLDPSNAVTLCRECHSWVHSRNNTEREFLA